jgi:hypothetical protein
MPSVGEGRVKVCAWPSSYIDRDNRDADLHADLNVPGSLPVGSFDCVILTQVLQFLSPRRRWPTSGRRSPPVGS